MLLRDLVQPAVCLQLQACPILSHFVSGERGHLLALSSGEVSFISLHYTPPGSANGWLTFWLSVSVFFCPSLPSFMSSLLLSLRLEQIKQKPLKNHWSSSSPHHSTALISNDRQMFHRHVFSNVCLHLPPRKLSLQVIKDFNSNVERHWRAGTVFSQIITLPQWPFSFIRQHAGEIVRRHMGDRMTFNYNPGVGFLMIEQQSRAKVSVQSK